MEKFGIFELLDALSALTKQEQTKEPPEEQSPSPADAAFSAPSYTAEPPAARPKGPAPDQALSNFYARHEEIAKKTRK